ncbi:hypothetical protein, partial [Dokdonella sp.]|uniref:hypothetical protein n=1 Tax=Dokdonella sp. TaxID=2291710 RepID=UPI00261AFE09
MLRAQDAQQLGLGALARVVGGKDIGGRTGGLRLLDRALALEPEVAQERGAVRGEVIERGQQARL